MLLLICPTCQSDLVEEGRNGRIDCLRCGDDFEFVDSKYKYVKLTAIRELTKSQPETKKIEIEVETPVEPIMSNGEGRAEYLQVVENYKKSRGILK